MKKKVIKTSNEVIESLETIYKILHNFEIRLKNLEDCKHIHDGNNCPIYEDTE